MAAKTVQLPEAVFNELNSLKIRFIKATDQIPTNGDMVHFAITIANNHFEEFSSLLEMKESGETDE